MSKESRLYYSQKNFYNLRSSLKENDGNKNIVGISKNSTTNMELDEKNNLSSDSIHQDNFLDKSQNQSRTVNRLIYKKKVFKNSSKMKEDEKYSKSIMEDKKTINECLTNQIKRHLTRKSNIQLDKKLKIKNSVCEIVYKYFCFFCVKKTNKIKDDFYKKGFEKINHHMNIINFIRKMEEVDFLKYILLNQDQLKIFHYLSTTSFLENFKIKVDSHLGIENLLKSYENLLCSKGSSDINERMVELVHSELNFD